MIERLPERVAIDILSKAYLTSQPSDGPLIWREYGGCNPLRTVAPLVCKAWNELIRSPAAGKVFFRRVRIVDACILPLRRFKPDALLRWFKERARLYVQVRGASPCTARGRGKEWGPNPTGGVGGRKGFSSVTQAGGGCPTPAT